MAINLDSALGIYPQALLLRSRRAELLAGNLANADTPHYKARDIDFRAALAAAQDAGTDARALVRTQANHLDTDGAGLPGGEMMYRIPTQPSLDGNTVDTQVEYAEFAQNAMRYQASLTFLTGRIKTLMTAIRGD
jgi:flagellar basal-body rod protein FlgB